MADVHIGLCVVTTTRNILCTFSRKKLVTWFQKRSDTLTHTTSTVLLLGHQVGHAVVICYSMLTAIFQMGLG